MKQERIQKWIQYKQEEFTSNMTLHMEELRVGKLNEVLQSVLENEVLNEVIQQLQHTPMDVLVEDLKNQLLSGYMLVNSTSTCVRTYSWVKAQYLPRLIKEMERVLK